MCHFNDRCLHSSRQNLTELVQLIDDKETYKALVGNARSEKAKKERQAGEEMRDASLKGMVRHTELSDLGELETATVREKQGQRREKR